MFAGPMYSSVFSNLEQQFKLAGKKRIVIGQIQTEQRKASTNDPRPTIISARPRERRSMVANC